MSVHKELIKAVRNQPYVAVSFDAKYSLALVNVLASAAISMRVAAMKMESEGHTDGAEAGDIMANGAFAFLGDVFEAYGLTRNDCAQFMNELTTDAMGMGDSTPDDNWDMEKINISSIISNAKKH